MKKESVVLFLKELMDDKIETVNFEIAQLMSSRDSDTKSSAGDKHETSRAMAQIEIENAQHQLSRFLGMREELDKIDQSKVSISIQHGNLVETNKGFFFFGIGLGKIEMNQEILFAVSLASPIGQVFKSKKVGDEFEFNGNSYSVEHID